MTEMLGKMGSVFDTAMGWVGSVGTAIESNDLLLIIAVIGIGGIAIDWFLRLLKQ